MVKYGQLFACLILPLLVGGKTTSPKESNLNSSKKESQSFRLPDTLQPIHYNVTLQPFLNGNFSIHGHVDITVLVLKGTNSITLHISDIITKNDTVSVQEVGANSSPIEILNQVYDANREFYIASLKQELLAGKTYLISMDFIGYLNDNLIGFYKLTYMNELGENVSMAATQFQPTDARKAFPCFDEPALKAKFTIQMAREEGFSSISNMPIIKTEPLEGQPGWYLDFYLTSVPMSTYLVAFVVSDFEYLASNASQNYSFNVWARPEWLDQGEYALEIGPKIMNFFEDFFNVSFPLPKQDMIAVPDMAGWAMENWGLVTYREHEMLHLPEQANAEHKKRISTVIAHELSHQWFGNLVSPSWWTDLWLNEGFASYMEHFGMDGVDPSLFLLQLIVVRYQHFAFELDCSKNSHPISVPVGHPTEINEIFDAISYQKGASIIRMMNHFLSEETFRRGLSNYLKKKSFANAEQDDLWRCLSNQAHADGNLSPLLTVKEIMDTWTLQMGYPVLTVSLNKDGTANLSQKRFLLRDNPAFVDNHEYRWWIPITYASQGTPDFEGTKPQDWMMPTEKKKVLQNVSFDGEWTIFNVKETGYYRVNYDEKNWKAITNQLEEDPTVIDPINRAQILDDSLNLARAGEMPYKVTLNLLSYLKNETDFIPIKAALRGMTYLMDMIYHYNDTRRESEYEMLKEFFLSVLTPIYQEVGFADSLSDPSLVQMKRSSILSWMCHLEDESCVNESISLFSQWMKEPDNFTIVSPNQKEAVFCTAIAKGGDQEWAFAWDRYLNGNFAKEKILLLQAMGCSSDEQTLVTYLKKALSPNEGIRKQDVEVVLGSVAQNPSGRAVAWNFVRENWNAITQYLGETSLTLRGLMEAFTKFLHTPSHLAELRSFKKKFSGGFGSAARAMRQAEEIVMTNIFWRKNYLPVILKWIKAKKAGTGKKTES